MKRRSLVQAAAALACSPLLPTHADLPDTVATVKASVLPVGYHRATDNPRFTLGGTGFIIDDGRHVVTNHHVIDGPLRYAENTMLVVLVRGDGAAVSLRRASVVESDPVHDLVLLRFEGEPLPALRLGDSDTVREGQAIAFTGFPIGGALGFSPVTHRGIVSSITPVALPSPSAGQLTAQALQALRAGSFNLFQLDATAYPGNSGGPLFDPQTGQVLGIVNMGLAKGTKESVLTSPSGISYAVPAKYVLPLLQRRGTR